MSRRLSLILCLASGLALAAAYPRAGAWPLAWVALTPWLVVVFTADRRAAILGSWLAGFAFSGAVMYWIAIFGYLPWFLLAAIEGLAFPLTAMVARVIAPPRSPWRVPAVALAWVVWEFVRSSGAYGMPWGQLGHSQAPFEALAQVAAFGGVPAISFVVIAANAAIAHAIIARGCRHAFAPLAVAALLAAAAVGLGAAHERSVARSPSPRAVSVRIALAQASVKTSLTVASLNKSLTMKEQAQELGVHTRLTREAAARGARIIIWPESAVPGYLQEDRLLRNAVTALARDLRVWLVVGGPTFEGGRDYNSAHVIAPSGAITGRYDKMHLVPFGEYVPGRHRLPLLRYYRVREVDITPGVSHEPLRVNGVALGPMICFESVFPDIAQSESRRGAQALMMITNDAWFLRTAAAAQHLQIGRFRAIEQGLWVARAASTGISCFIDPRGRVTQSLGLMRRGVLVADLPARRAPTVYQRIGPVLPPVCAGVLVVWLIAKLAVDARRRGKRGGASSDERASAVAA